MKSFSLRQPCKRVIVIERSNYFDGCYNRLAIADIFGVTTTVDQAQLPVSRVKTALRASNKRTHRVPKQISVDKLYQALRAPSSVRSDDLDPRRSPCELIVQR